MRAFSHEKTMKQVRGFRQKAMRRSLFGSTLLAALLATAPAHAGDTEDATLFGALGLTAATGETKLGTGAGDIEAWLLTAGGLDAVAAEIRGRLGGAGSYVLLTPDEKINLGAPTVLASRIAFLKAKIENRACKVPPPPGVGAAAAVAPSIGDIGAALATDTTITGIVVAAQDRALVSALAAKRLEGQKFFIPSDAVAPSKSELVTNWNDLAFMAERCREDPANKDAAEVRLYDALDKEVNARTDGASLLERAAATAALVEQTPKIVRVAIERAGGTTVVRSNVWYKLGFPGAVVMGGGLIASFRVINPASGEIEKAGIVRCGFPQRSFHKITSVPVAGPGCVPATTKG